MRGAAWALVTLMGLSCGQPARRYELEGIQLGMTADEVSRLHPTVLTFREFQLNADRFSGAASKTFRGWTDFSVTATPAGTVTAILASRVGADVGWSDVRSRLEASLGRPDHEEALRSGEQTILTWGNVSLAKSDNPYGDISPQFTCSGPCAVVSHVDTKDEDFLDVSLRTK